MALNLFSAFEEGGPLVAIVCGAVCMRKNRAPFLKGQSNNTQSGERE